MIHEIKRSLTCDDLLTTALQDGDDTDTNSKPLPIRPSREDFDPAGTITEVELDLPLDLVHLSCRSDVVRVVLLSVEHFQNL